MLVDRKTAVWNGVTVTADGQGDSVDMLTSGYWGRGEPLYAHVVAEDVVKTGTYKLTMFDAPRADATTGNLAGGRGLPEIVIDLDPDLSDQYKYVALPLSRDFQRWWTWWADVGGTSPSAKLTAWFGPQRPAEWRAYAGSSRRLFARPND